MDLQQKERGFLRQDASPMRQRNDGAILTPTDAAQAVVFAIAFVACFVILMKLGIVEVVVCPQ